jgi:hypothetical protein
MTNTQLQEIRNKAVDLNKASMELEVTSQQMYDVGANFITGCKELKAKIEDWFMPTIEQFKRAKKEAEKGRKEHTEKMNFYLEPVEKAMQTIQIKCKHYENEQIRIAKEKEEELKREEEALRSFGDKEALVENNLKQEFLEPTINKQTNLGIRRSWKWKVIDEAKIPREFLLIDTVKLNKYVREHQDKTQIAGIEAYYD